MFPPKAPTASFPYRIEAQIGEGAMGVVYRAQETSLNRPVAIKILRSDYVSSLRQEQAAEVSHRFLQEARAAAALSHPGITTIYRVGVEGGVAFIAMEWLDGVSLEDAIASRAPMPLREAVQLTIRLLEALEVAHDGGIVHRDIKPANLIVLSNGRIKITDFGIAHVQNSELVKTQAGAMMGTPLYAAPEQLSGREVDGRADLYAVGVVLYEMLTGAVPFDADNLMKLMSMILSDHPRSPRQINPSISPVVEQILLKAISRDPADRYRSAREMAEALEPFADPHAIPTFRGSMTDSAVTLSMNQTLDPRASESSTLPPLVGLDEPTVDAAASQVPTRQVQSRTPLGMVAEVVLGWPGPRELGAQAPMPLLQRLLERPLHAEPFCGAALLDDALVLLQDGLIYGMLDIKAERVGDAVLEGLGPQAQATLFTLPAGRDPRLIPALASSLHAPKVRHGDLDTSFVDLPQMAQKLADDNFTGAIRLHQGPEQALLLYAGGDNLLNVFTRGLGEAPLGTSWQGWIRGKELRADVEDQRVVLPLFTYRQELRDFALEVEPFDLEPSSGGGQKASMLGSAVNRESLRASLSSQLDMRIRPAGEAGLRGTATMNGILSNDPSLQFLRFLITELPLIFQERTRNPRKHWKYIYTWIGEIRRATLHHQLPRPGSADHDLFDLATSDADGKILHLMHRISQGSGAGVKGFVDRVVAAKQARMDAGLGDIGGVFLVAPSFDQAATEVYEEAIARPEGGSLLHKGLDAFTGYEGFVRMGSRRGFHLLLLVETPQGSYTPLFPG